MSGVPDLIGGARVLLFTSIDERHKHTSNTDQVVAGKLMGPAIRLAICKYEGEEAYYLFSCDEGWDSITDTYHESVEQAKEQAEFEYEGITATWQTKI
ncbi:MAG: hypothetical protein PSX80_05205 [bacterium]|nr:hypothetical protein [bacterium]